MRCKNSNITILSVYCFGNFSAGLLTFSTTFLNTTLQSIYNVDIFFIEFCTTIYMINYAVFLVPSYYFEDRYGIKNTVIFGLLLLVIGSLIRCGAFYSFWWIFVGSCISACSLPFVFNPITKISAIWFQEDKRIITTTVAMIFLTSGQAIGSGMGPQMVTPENSNIEVFYLMFTQFLICLSSLILYLLFFQNQPADFIPREETHQLTIKEELRVLFKSSNFVYLFSSAVIGGGVGNYLSVILELVAHDHGFSSQESSYFGMISILSGVVSCFVCSLITSATHKFKLVCVVTSGGTILGLMFIALAFKIHSFTLAALASAFNGIFLSPVYSVPLEFACEVTFPLRENVSSSLIACLGTVFAVIPITVAYLFENDSYKCLEIGIGLQVISFIFILITREDLKRRNAELMKNVDDSRLVIND